MHGLELHGDGAVLWCSDRGPAAERRNARGSVAIDTPNAQWNVASIVLNPYEIKRQNP